MSFTSRFCCLCKQCEESTIWHNVWGYVDRNQVGTKCIDIPVFFVGKAFLDQERVSPLLRYSEEDGLVETVDIATLPFGKENAVEIGIACSKSFKAAEGPALNSRARHSRAFGTLHKRPFHAAKTNVLDSKKRKLVCSSWLGDSTGSADGNHKSIEKRVASCSQILAAHMSKAHPATFLPAMDAKRQPATSFPTRFPLLGEWWMQGACKRRKLQDCSAARRML